MTKEPKIRSIGKNLVEAVANVVYTCPANYVAKMTLLFISNHGGNNKTISIQWYDASADETYYIVGDTVLSANSYLKLDGSYLVLNPGDTVIATPELGATTDATITVEEYYEQALF